MEPPAPLINTAHTDGSTDRPFQRDGFNSSGSQRQPCANRRTSPIGRIPTVLLPYAIWSRTTHTLLLATLWNEGRSEEHTSELQSLMRISYAVFCLKKTNTRETKNNDNNNTLITHKPQ